MRDNRPANMLIRDIVTDDIDRLLALNNASVPHVNELVRDDLIGLLAMAAYGRLVTIDDKLAGFLIALWPGVDYASAHYRWFSEHYQSFLYVDRVAIDEAATGTGLGRAFYADLEGLARSHGAPRITLEVNSLPPNPRSLAFHRRMGFKAVGELEHDGGAKRVVLMEKVIDTEQREMG